MQNAMFAGLCISILGAILFAVVLGKRTTTPSDHFLADRKLSLLAVASLFISTSMALAGAVFSSIWLGYSVGLSSVVLQFLWFIGFLILARFSEKIASLSDNGTLHSNISHSFGKAAGRAAAYVTLLGFTLIVGWESVVAADMFRVISDSNEFLFIVMLSLVCCASAYTAIGGIAGNVSANRFQNGLAYVALAYLLFTFVSRDVAANGIQTAKFLALSSWNPFNKTMLSLTVGGLTSILLTSLTWQLVDASTWENIAAHRSGKKGIKKPLFLSAAVVFVAGGLAPTILGHYIARERGLTENSIVSHIFLVLQQDPIGISLVVAGFTGAMLSTIDSFVLACTETICWDILGNAKDLPRLSIDVPETRSTELRGEGPEEPYSTTQFEEESELDLLSDTGALGANSGVMVETRQNSNMTQSSKNFFVAKILGIACGVLGGAVAFLLRYFGVGLYNVVWIAYLSQCTLIPVCIAMLLQANGTVQIKKSSAAVASIISGLTVGLSYGIVCVWGNPGLLSWTPVVGVTSSALVFILVGISERKRQSSS